MKLCAAFVLLLLAGVTPCQVAAQERAVGLADGLSVSAPLGSGVYVPVLCTGEKSVIPLRQEASGLGGWKGALVGAVIGGAIAAVPILIVGEQGDSPLEEPIFWIGISIGALGGLIAEW